VAKGRTYTLYVVKLHEGARERVMASLDRYDRSRVNPKLPSLYVGYTSSTPKRRLEKHLSGDRVGSSIVRDHGIGLLKSFTRGRRRLQTEDEALEAEAALAEELRERGYAVYGRHGERLHLRRRGY
jgi:predicted GIY-YIG superfamily endonuclease